MMELRTDRFKFKELFPDKAKRFAQKLHIKADEIEFVRKGIPIDPKDIEVKEGERAAIRLITTPHLDRDGEILIPHGAVLDDFRQSPSVLYAHDYKGLPIGHDQWIKITKEGIIAKTSYATHQFAEDVFQCVKHGDLNSNSVGFIPVEMVKPDDKKQFEEWQDVLEKDYGIDKKESGKAKGIYPKYIVLEHSDVPVASNAQSLNLAVSKGEVEIKSERLRKDLEIEVMKDAEDKEIEIEIEGKVLKVKEPILSEEEEEQEIEIEKTLEETIESGEGGILDEHGKEITLEEFKEGFVTKPETTENYHHIPVRSKNDFVSTSFRMIDISKSKGIKATIGKLKSDPQGSTQVQKYLFDVNKWSMAEAQTWVNEHKPKSHERWNRSLSKLFDIASAESSAPMRFHFDLYEKFLECKIKDVFQNTYTIPSPLMGSYLAGFKELLGEFDLKDTRRFGYSGDETPPNYEVINLNSEKTDDFLVDGMQFYEAEKRPLIVHYSPEWYGMTVTLITSNKNDDWNKNLLDKAHAWVKKNNFLRGEKFALSGEFLKEPGDNWDNLILKDKYKNAIMMSAKALEKKGENLVGRGLLFMGPPGTGKTKTGRVLMNELDATFIWISSRDFRHVGPLRALAVGFSMARDLAPSVLFLEDIDTWLRGEMEYVTDSLKTEMDGIKQNKGMVTIMTSNYPEKLPEALLDRPGRFHHIVNFELPGKEQREKMITQWAGDIGDELLKELVEKTDGFSGAHLKELVEFAKMISDEEEIEIGDAMLRSLDKLTEQRELIDEIRANKEDAKAVWGRLKLVDGEIKVSKEIEVLRDDVSDELEVTKGEGKEIQQGETKTKECEHRWIDISYRSSDYGKTLYCTICYETKFIPDEPDEKIMSIYEKLLEEKDDHIADLKAGRVLSRKNRNIVKDAITALNAVLKADAAGTQEDTDAEGEGNVTEREIEIEKSEEQGLSEEDTMRLINERTMSPEAMKMMEKAIKESLTPENLKKAMQEIARLEVDRIRGKVR